MPINKPYYRTYRQLLDGSYADSGNGRYVSDKKYAVAPTNYVRAFELIQKDFVSLLDYVEPCDDNLHSYSFRSHELILRACVEFEANSKAILKENGYSKSERLDISDYHKLEKTHFLSQYKVKLPYWNGKKQVIAPFSDLKKSTGFSPYWYQAYNSIKHERVNELQKASLRNVVGALAGLFVILSAQFGTHTPQAFGSIVLGIGDIDSEYSDGIGKYFGIRFPSRIPKKYRYDFNWSELAKQEEPFQKLFP